MDRRSGKILSGEEAPYTSELQNWLQVHPGWEIHEESGDESGEGESEDEAGPSTAAVAVAAIPGS